MLHKVDLRSFKRRLCTGGASLALTLSISPVLQAQQASIERAPITEISSDHGPAAPQQPLSVTVHMQMRNRAAFDKAVEAIYTAGSPTYHQWMTEKDIAAYAPAQQDLETVKKELESHGLTAAVSADGLSIRATGTVASVEEAFHTQIRNFEREGRIFHANAAPAQLGGPAGALIEGVTGMTNISLKPQLSRQVNVVTGQPISKPVNAATALSAGGWSTLETNDCFAAPKTVTFQTTDPTKPAAAYYGNVYSPGKLPCSWTPTQIQAHYGLSAAYNAGLDGTGQTIVILEGPTDGAQMVKDLKTFSQLSGLPFNSADVKVYYPDGPPLPGAIQFNNVGVETAIDVDWVHAIAPKAKIAFLIAPSFDWDEFTVCLNYARQHKLGNVISISYGLPEYAWGPSVIKPFDRALELLAAAGVAVNISSGDSGDEGITAPGTSGASYPATSAYATAIGGTGIALPNGTKTGIDVGWGHNATFLSDDLTTAEDPPFNDGFAGGAGGGISYYISKPSWQKSLSGTQRRVPDIASLADPYTGVGIVFNGMAEEGWGGTSLAAPIFSAMWALANQKAGKSLGQAGPLLTTLSQNKGTSSPITDIVPFSSSANVAGFVTDAKGFTAYSAAALMAPLGPTSKFFSALWNLGGGEYLDLGFGIDTSLHTATGWDNVTGWGSPNGYPFIQAAAQLAK